MAEAYKVGVTLELRDLVGARLASLWDDFDKLEKKTVQVRRRLRDLGVETAGLRDTGGAVRAMQRDMLLAEKNIARMGGAFKSFNGGNAAGGVRALHGEFQRAQASAASLGAEIGGIGVQAPELRAAASAIGRMSINLATAGQNARTLGAHLHGVASSATRIPAMPNIPRVGLGGGVGRGVGGGHGGAGGLHGGGVHVGSHGVGVGALGMGVGGAAGIALVGGYLGARAIGSTVHSAGEYSREQAQFEMFGMSAAQNAAAKRIAETMNAPGTSKIDAMKYVTEAQGIFRESGMEGDHALEAASRVAPVLAKMQFASGLLGKEFSDEQGLNLIRSIEMMGGLKSPQRMNELANDAFKLLITSGGNVDPSQLRQAIRTGGTSVKGLSADALFGYGEPLMGEMKGGAFGTALSTAYGRVNGLVKLPNQALHEMMRLGLWDKDAIVLNKNGGLDHVKEGKNPLVDAGKYASNPFEYYRDKVRPSYDKMGFDEQQRARENALIFGRTGGSMFNLVDQQMATLAHSVEAFKKALGLDKAVDKSNEQLSGSMRNFEAAWTDFKTVFGDNLLPTATTMLKVGTGFLKEAGDFVSHPIDTAIRWAKHYQTDGQGMNPFDDSSAGGAGGKSRPDPVAKPSAATVQVHTAIQLNNKTIADAVTTHQAKQMNGNLGSGFYDLGLGLPSVGMK